MEIKEIYEKFDKIGSLSFSTINNGYVESRIAHFFAYDDNGLYFRTMNTKPFYNQLIETKNVSVCGIYPQTQIAHDDNGLPYFKPGYTIRISGDVYEVSEEELNKRAKGNNLFNVALHDVKKYPATKIFVLYKAHGEVFDYDFAKENRGHKLERERFQFKNVKIEQPGLIIGDSCIACGKCYNVCTFNAIKPGDTYQIIGNRCDECGNCKLNCPVDSIYTKLELNQNKIYKK